MKLFKMSRILPVITLFILLGTRCEEESKAPFNVSTSPDGVTTITDRTGKEWDISHAISVYDFAPQNFNYGLGPNAIKPIINPDFFSPNDLGYPSFESQERIIGVNINGDARAYSINVLSGHEVVNDVAGGTPIAAVY